MIPKRKKCFFIILNNATKEQLYKLEFAFKYFGYELDIPGPTAKLFIDLNAVDLDEETFIKLVKYADVEYFEIQEDTFGFAGVKGRWQQLNGIEEVF